MAKQTVIPFGPQHPVLPEPIHFDLVVEDERVIQAVPQIGFVHRGLEKLVEKRDLEQLIYVMERVCGICSFGHSMAYAEAVESLMGIEVPRRAECLRVIWHELSRVHSHLLWMGLAADAFGFESLFMHCWRLRERVLGIFERTVGARVTFSAVCVGGVTRDLDATQVSDMRAELDGIRCDYDRICKAFTEDKTVRNRTVGVARISREKALEMSMVGPFARASGVDNDVRTLGNGGYAYLNCFSPIMSDEGDCYARIVVRAREVLQSIDIIDEMLSKLPQGEIAVPAKGTPEIGSQAAIVLEQPRGEAFYYVRGNGTRYLDRVRVRTPTSQNLAGMVTALAGCDLADVNMIILTIDPCISCTER
jgi:ech hydrogenase subunit E